MYSFMYTNHSSLTLGDPDVDDTRSTIMALTISLLLDLLVLALHCSIDR